jgi:hypothetical protein
MPATDTESDHSQDTLDAALRAELSRLENRRRQDDARIAHIRSLLDPKSLDVFPDIKPETAGAHDRGQSARPRGRAQRRLFVYLQQHPGAGYRELVDGVVGTYNKETYAKMRNTVRAMKGSHWLSGEPGKWVLGNGKAP